MKSIAKQKIAGMMALLLIISILTPILAFAATSLNASYSNGSVTGSVYTDVYANGGVTVYVYAPDGTMFKTITTVTYSTYGNGYLNTLPTVSGLTYSYVTLTTGSVSQLVYNSISSGSPGPSGPSTPTVPPGTVTADPTGNIDTNTLKNAFANSITATLKITGDFALLPASALVDAAKKDGASITITSDIGTYTLPLSVLKLDDLAKALGINVADLIIKVTISKVTGATADAIKAAAGSSGATLLADAVDFNVQAVGKDGKTVNVDFGKTYVSRTLNVNSTVDSSKTTGVLYNPDTKTFSFVPSTFATANGKTVATLMRNGNSIYTVASFNKSFTDIATHWAKNDVQLLANKAVISGMTETTFAPENNITRAQFAALVVRALGLSASATSTSFSDVQASDWFAADVAAASKAGLVFGYENGTFAPNKQINREELAALVVRALKYAGVKTDVTAAQQTSLLANYTDTKKIVWAQADIAAAINAGIIVGLTDTTIGSDKTATRAQSAAMLKRFLTKAGFIN